MKKNAIALLYLFSLLFHQKLDAQEDFYIKNIFKINVARALFGELPLGYERFISEKTSLDFGASYVKLDFYEVKIERIELSDMGNSNGFSLSAGIKTYIDKHPGPTGLYFNPQIMYQYTEFNKFSYSTPIFKTKGEINKQIIATKFLIGLQYYFVNYPFLIDLYSGLGLRKHLLTYYPSLIQKLDHNGAWEDLELRPFHSDDNLIYYHLGVQIGIIF